MVKVTVNAGYHDGSELKHSQLRHTTNLSNLMGEIREARKTGCNYLEIIIEENFGNEKG